MITRRLLCLTAGCALLVAPGAWAQEVVWDSPVDPNITAFVDQQFPDFPDFSTYLVGHVHFDRDTEIHDIKTYFTNANNAWPQGVLNGVLNIIPQDGLPPNDYDPSSDGVSLTATMAPGANGLEFTASLGGGTTLTAGAYWIGLTPDIDFGVFGQEFHQGTADFEKNTAGRNPGGGFGVGTDWFEAGPTFGGIDWGLAVTITGKNAKNDCPWDLDGSGDVGTNDLILLLGSWGDPYGTEDLIELLGAWGDCP